MLRLAILSCTGPSAASAGAATPSPCGPVIGPDRGFDFDVAVLGAGAAGLMAAARAAECGARVVLLEKNRRAGVKILISGGTRCNITNARGLRRLDVVSRPDRPGV